MDKITLSNIGTYHEIEYLKKTLGPVLISALAEVCMKRPTDPIEYLGHWLLRWRYNEELKKRDMENSIQVIRQKQEVKCEEEMNMRDCQLPLDPYGQGVIPLFPFLPPGYGGPITPEELAALQIKEEEEEEEELEGEGAPPMNRMGEMLGEDYDYGQEMPGEGGYDPYQTGYGYDNPMEQSDQYEPGYNTDATSDAPQDWTYNNQYPVGDDGQPQYQDPGQF